MTAIGPSLPHILALPSLLGQPLARDSFCLLRPQNSEAAVVEASPNYSLHLCNASLATCRHYGCQTPFYLRTFPQIFWDRGSHGMCFHVRLLNQGQSSHFVNFHSQKIYSTLSPTLLQKFAPGWPKVSLSTLLLLFIRLTTNLGKAQLSLQRPLHQGGLPTWPK